MNAVHEIYSITPDDAGTYICQATNAAGISEESVHIRVDDDIVDVAPSGCRGDQPCNEEISEYPQPRPRPLPPPSSVCIY